MIVQVLVIGCGNIGALYDIDKKEIQTHCKALSLLPNIQVTVFDPDFSLSQNISLKYNFLYVEYAEQIVLKKYQWVVIASPTNTHFYWLSKCFEAEVKLVVCEKPIAKTDNDLMQLLRFYKEGKTQVVVNYIRRFQQAYIDLKKHLHNTNPINIVVKYQRGIINNFSHAADLIGFLFGFSKFENLKISEKVFDEFEDDPTVSFTANYNNVPISVVGLANVKYSYFEIELFFENQKISIVDSGNSIVYQHAENYDRFYKPLISNNDILNNNILQKSMQSVYSEVQKIYKNGREDNFLFTLKMNQQLLQIIQ